MPGIAITRGHDTARATMKSTTASAAASDAQVPDSLPDSNPPAPIAPGDWALMPLMMPSDVSASDRPTTCIPGLADKERRMRIGQARDALQLLRRQLRMRSTLQLYKTRHIQGPGQAPNTRARASIQTFTDKINRTAQRYRAARAALEALDPKGSWTKELQVLRDADVRGMTAEEDVEDADEGDSDDDWFILLPGHRRKKAKRVLKGNPKAKRPRPDGTAVSEGRRAPHHTWIWHSYTEDGDDGNLGKP